MKRIALLLAGLGFCLLSQAEEPVRNFYFSGYKVVLIPSDTFRVEMENPDLGIQELKDGTLSFTLKDANGPMPKGVVRLYTNDIRRISMIYSELKTDKPFAVDSLSVSLAAGSKGAMNVKAKYLQVSAGAGSQFTLKGETDVLDCMTKGNSHVNLQGLKVKKKQCKELHVESTDR